MNQSTVEDAEQMWPASTWKEEPGREGQRILAHENKRIDVHIQLLKKKVRWGGAELEDVNTRILPKSNLNPPGIRGVGA